MNPSEYLELVASVINSHKPYAGGTYLLSFFEGHFHLSRSSSAIADFTEIAVFTSRDLNEGLTVEAWNQIQNKISILISRGVL